MMRLLISGACGRMGRMIAQEAPDKGFVVAAGVDSSAQAYAGFPMYADFSKINEAIDVLIDFSGPGALDGILAYAVAHRVPCVLGTTGYPEDAAARIVDAVRHIPIFRSANMSRGVYVLRLLAAQAARMLPDFDIEIVEKHHNKKADSPSGTALSLLDAVKNSESLPVFGREGKQALRRPGEIGVHAVRGGTVAGEHEVGFYGNNEVITLSHHAQSRGVFVSGALSAAAWLVRQPPGLYGMPELMGKPEL